MKVFWKVTYEFNGKLKYIYFRTISNAFRFAKIANAKSVQCVMGE